MGATSVLSSKTVEIVIRCVAVYAVVPFINSLADWLTMVFEPGGRDTRSVARRDPGASRAGAPALASSTTAWTKTGPGSRTAAHGTGARRDRATWIRARWPHARRPSPRKHRRWGRRRGDGLTHSRIATPGCRRTMGWNRAIAHRLRRLRRQSCPWQSLRGGAPCLTGPERSAAAIRSRCAALTPWPISYPKLDGQVVRPVGMQSAPRHRARPGTRGRRCDGKCLDVHPTPAPPCTCHARECAVSAWKASFRTSYEAQPAAVPPTPEHDSRRSAHQPHASPAGSARSPNPGASPPTSSSWTPRG